MAPIHGCDEDNNSTIISALDMKHSSDAPNMPPASPPLTSSGGVVINVQHADSKKSPQYSPTNMSDEDNYECYGDGVQLELESNGSLSVSGDSSEHRPPNSINRHTWCRTSLRRSPKSNQDNLPNRRWGSFRHSGKRQLGSNALASQLYRSSSFNSSGRSSTCDTADDMYSDVSLEEDVLDLNHKVQLLQQQVNVLADSANTTDDRYVRVKADNAALQARVHMLEEQLREVELRAEERMQDEQRRQREIMVRVEREKQLQLENASIRLQTLELEVASLRDEISRERAIVKSLRDERNEAAQRALEAETLLKENSDELQVTKEAIRRHKQEYESAKHIIEELSKELELCRLEKSNSEISNIPPIDTGRLEELQAELDSLRMDNRSLKNMNEELQEALLTRSVEEGKSLLVGTEESLAAEFEAMSHDQMQQALKEQQDVNTHLRLYIDNILLNIVENYPQLLEVKHLPT